MNTLAHTTRSRIAATAGLICGLTCTAARSQDADPGTPPTDKANAVPLSEVWRGLRDKFKPSPTERPASAATPSEPERTEVAPTPPGAGPDVKPMPLKIKDFTAGAKKTGGWNDTHCKVLVEPFGLTDGAMSLTNLRLRQKSDSLKSRLTGAPKAHGDSRAEIRQAARELNWLPMAAEVAIGERLHAGQTSLLREDSKSGREAYARAKRLLQQVLSKIDEPHPYNFRIFVTTASEGNAEAAPGGYIYVDKNLVDKASEEPRALFAIAHEVAHVLQRHRTRETQMRLSDSVDSIEKLMKLITAARSKDSSAIVKTGVDLKRLFVRHSEEQELQADGCGVRLVDAATANSTATVTAVEAFVRALPPAQPAPPPQKETAETIFSELGNGELSRHPTTTQRLSNLRQVMAELRARR